MGFLVSKSTRINAVDGKFRQCPHCNEPLACYQTNKKSDKAFREVSGYICTECGMICINLKELNELVELFGKS
jgi:uncharacterized protein with PIN domain